MAHALLNATLQKAGSGVSPMAHVMQHPQWLQSPASAGTLGCPGTIQSRWQGRGWRLIGDGNRSDVMLNGQLQTKALHAKVEITHAL
jgi:hypothetical protein